MKKTYKLNGKIVSKKPIGAVLVATVNEEHYETKDYQIQQSINASDYFARMREMREDLEARHG